MKNDNFEAACKEWSVFLGSRLQVGESVQKEYEVCTFPISRRIPAAIKAVSTDEVIHIVQIANQYHVPLYTISTGNNWGYGSANPVVDDCVILDLSLMNSIINFDEQLGVITLQPGVTQQILHQFLLENELPFLVPTTGAGPNCSIVGNALERGYGITPYADHFGAVTSMKVVLADGTLYESFHGSIGAHTINNTYKWGLGPYLDGIFSQGNCGIVTEMTILLANKPQLMECFVFEFTHQNFETNVSKIKNILSRIENNGGISIFNRRRSMTIRQIPYPYDDIEKGAIISESLLEKLGKQHDIAEWTGVGCLYGTKEQVRTNKKMVKNILFSTVKKGRFITPKKLEIAQRIGSYFQFIPPVKNVLEKISLATKGLELLQGIPNESILKIAYWKKGQYPKDHALNPDIDGCGIIWYAPLLPIIPEKISFFIKNVYIICERFGVEPVMTLNSMSQRCFNCTVPIIFDLHNAEESQRSRNCYKALLELGKEHGVFPYRLDVETMSQLAKENSSYWDTVKTIKKALDPNNILSPNRYS